MKEMKPVMRFVATGISLFCLHGAAQTTPTTTNSAATETTTADPRVQMIQSMRAEVKIPDAKRKSSYELTIKGGDWVDTNVLVLTGDNMTFTTSGSMTLADSRTITADGLPRGWRDMLRQFPLENSNAGALIGRISDSSAAVPFLIGASSTQIARQSGHLFVRPNLGTDMSVSSGTFKLKITFADASKQAAKTAQTTAAVHITAAVFDTLPRRVTDQQGNEGDVVNFAMLGTEDQVKDAFARSGWQTVDSSVQNAVVQGLLDTLQHKAYLTMPMSTLYLFGRPQDMSYARADAIEVAAVRHHLRVWKSDQVIDGKTLWVGSSTHDDGFEKDQRNGGVTHHIDPNIDQERDFIKQSFDASGSFSEAAYVTPLNPVSSAKTATGGEFHTDGRILVMVLN